MGGELEARQKRSKDAPDHTLLVNVGVLFDVRVIRQLQETHIETGVQAKLLASPTLAVAFRGAGPNEHQAPDFHAPQAGPTWSS